MSLTAEPAAASIPASGGNSVHKLNNGGAEKIVFKIKSSNNNEYRITPVFGFVEAGAGADISITRTAGPPKEDKLVIHFGPAPADVADAQAAFAAVSGPQTITLPLSAA